MVATTVEEVLAARGVKPCLSNNLSVLATVEAIQAKRLLFIGVGCQVQALRKVQQHLLGLEELYVLGETRVRWMWTCGGWGWAGQHCALHCTSTAACRQSHVLASRRDQLRRQRHAGRVRDLPTKRQRDPGHWWVLCVVGHLEPGFCDPRATAALVTVMPSRCDALPAVLHYEFMQNYNVFIKHTDGHTEKVPYFSLPAKKLSNVIAPSYYSCFDYTNALADLTVGYMGAVLRQISWRARVMMPCRSCNCGAC